jgi:hypothetical protein
MNGSALLTDAIALVAMESLMGVPCPLTVWEYELWEMAGQRSVQQIGFIARLVRSVIFYDFPGWAFTVACVSFALLVAGTFLFVRPRRKGRSA